MAVLRTLKSTVGLARLEVEVEVEVREELQFLHHKKPLTAPVCLRERAPRSPGMTDIGSPPRYRIANLRGFLPLSDEASISTRGQALPSLIQSRSTTNIATLKDRASQRRETKRRSSFNEDTPRRSTDSREDVENQLRHTATLESSFDNVYDSPDRRMSVLMTPQMRSQRLIGNSNPRYKWEQYYKSPEQLKSFPKRVRKYYERNNYLIQQYLYIDRLLDSSLPHNLIQEYNQPFQTVAASSGNGTFAPHVPATITEEPASRSRSNSDSTGPPSPMTEALESGWTNHGNGYVTKTKIKRTPQNLYKVPNEETPLINKQDADGDEEAQIMPPDLEPEDETGSSSRIVTIAIYINLAANTVLLAMKIVVAVLTSSVSVLASLVDAALDFLSTAIVWTTTFLISHNDNYQYPIGRRRLEPVGVLVFSVIMITSFFQVALEGFNHLNAKDHTIVQLTIPAIVIMAATVGIKFCCWLWCRLINNSSVQALAQDAMTDVVFNIFSIIFPLIGYYASVWWLDPLGGILLSFYVIFNWAGTSSQHIKNLTGAAATADERNILLYLTMRFAKTVKQIQGLNAYHSGDKLNVEVDIVLDEGTNLRDSHDLGESLQYVLESVPTVDRAFVHLDYAGYNLPTHMVQTD